MTCLYACREINGIFDKYHDFSSVKQKQLCRAENKPCVTKQENLSLGMINYV